MNFGNIKSNPFFYSKQSLPSLNLKNLAIYHPRHTTQTTDILEAKLFPTQPSIQQSCSSLIDSQSSKSYLPYLKTNQSEVEQDERQNLSFSQKKTPKSFSNVAHLKQICKTETVEPNYKIEHHLNYLDKRAPQRQIGMLVNKVNHAQLEKYHHLFDEIQKKNPNEKIPIENMNQFIANIQNSTLKYSKSSDKSKQIISEIDTMENQEKQKHMRMIQISERNRKKRNIQNHIQTEEQLSSHRSQISQQQSNNHQNQKKISNFYFYQHQNTPNKNKLVDAIKRLSFQVNKLQHELPKDPSIQNKFDSLQFFFQNLYICLEKLINEKKNWANIISKTNGYNNQIRNFLFEVNQQHGNITGIKYSSGKQMFDHFISSEFHHKFSNINHNSIQLLQQMSESQLLKKLIYFSTQLEDYLIQKIYFQLDHDILQKKNIQESIIKMLKEIKNEEEYKQCIPIKYQTAGRSLKTQIDEIMKKYQNLNKLDKFDIINSEILDQQEKITSQIRNTYK